MKVLAYQVPQGVLCGNPPKRIVDVILAYSPHAIVGRTHDRSRFIVFDGWRFAEDALRTPRNVIESWYTSQEETQYIPCIYCRNMVHDVDELENMPPELRVAAEEKHAASCTWVTSKMQTRPDRRPLERG